VTEHESQRTTRSVVKVCTVIASVALWLGAVGAGFLWLLDYSMTPGAAECAPQSWPSESGITRNAGLPTLVMFAHPLCPCSRASITELDELLRRAGPMTAHVLMLDPDGVGEEWRDQALRDAAAAIPGVTVSSDKNGVEARRFGAGTSGHVVVYSDSGRLLFSGGITAARGHVGNNVGLERALASVQAGNTTCARSPVFGCGLEAPR
jgi:hypothetical protein